MHPIAPIEILVQGEESRSRQAMQRWYQFSSVVPQDATSTPIARKRIRHLRSECRWSAGSPALVMGDPDFDLDFGSARAARSVADASSVTGESTSSSRGDEAHTSKSEIENRQSKIHQSLLTSAATRSLSRSFRSLKLKRLQGSADEARTSARLLGDERAPGLGEQARERELKAVLSPRVLHLATHGFFLGDQEFKQTNSLPSARLLKR